MVIVKKKTFRSSRRDTLGQDGVNPLSLSLWAAAGISWTPNILFSVKIWERAKENPTLTLK